MTLTASLQGVSPEVGAIAPETVAIHQPNYFGWLGFFHKVASCDLFVILDDVQFVRRGYIHRNRIKTPQGVSWLTVPTLNKGHYHAPINEIMPAYDEHWTDKHRRTIQHCYGKCQYFDEVCDRIVDPVLHSAADQLMSLADVGTESIIRVFRYLGIKTPMVRSSSIDIDASSTQRLIEIVQRFGGRRYLSGQGARKYMAEEMFETNDIELEYASFEMPTYDQPHGPFVPGLSILDTLFCCGRETRNMLGLT